jgi:hypothetical protein
MDYTIPTIVDYEIGVNFIPTAITKRTLKGSLTVRRRGLEPPHPYGHIHLKDACLPVSTPAHIFIHVVLLQRMSIYITFTRKIKNPPVSHMLCKRNQGVLICRVHITAMR